jgi:prolyl-tRNA synthetase
MSDGVKKVRVPDAIMPQMVEFQMLKDHLQAGMEAARVVYQKETTRLQTLAAQADTNMAKLLQDNKVIEVGQPFGIDTRYAEEGVAFVLLPQDEDTVAPTLDPAIAKIFRDKMN